MSDGTKYGEKLPDDGVDALYQGDEVPEQAERTEIKRHEIDVVYVTDPGETGGYGREKYTARIRYDETEGPEVLYVVEHRWKGNYWRDVTDWDYRDVPEPVRQHVAAALPVDSPADLELESRLMDEGGESRWEKHHKRQVQEATAPEMWGRSSLGDALEYAENAAEAFEDGTENEQRAEAIVEELLEAVEAIDEANTEPTEDA